MTKQTKLLVCVISVAVIVAVGVLFILLRDDSDLTVQAPAPPREVTPPLLSSPTASIIAVKASLPLQEVKQAADSALRGYLSKPIKWKKGDIEAAIKLNLETITMTSAENGAISMEVPFRFTGGATVSKKIFAQVLQQHEEIAGHATASVTLTPTLNPDWRITADVASDISVEQAEINVWGIKISVRKVLTELIENRVLPRLEAHIVKYITNVDVKTRVAGLWAQLYEPITVSQTPPIVLTIEPLEILAQELSSDGQTLSLNFGVKAYIQVNMGEAATASHESEIPTLPNIRFVDTLGSGYHIIAPMEMAYAAVETLAKPHVEKSHEFKGVEALVEDLELYGSGTQLVAGVQFRVPALAASGQLYLLGTPVYDATAMSLAVTEFDYSLTTRDLFLDIAQVVGEGFFPDLRTTVEEKLVFPMEDQLTRLRELLVDVIAARPIGSYVVLRGTVDTVIPEALYLTQTGIRVPFRLQGDLACEVSLKGTQTAQ